MCGWDMMYEYESRADEFERQREEDEKFYAKWNYGEDNDDGDEWVGDHDEWMNDGADPDEQDDFMPF